MGVLATLRRRREEPPVPGGRWLVVGLGNPGREYEGTRHNLGADVVRRLAERLDASFTSHKTGSQVADTFTRPGGPPVSLILPSGYMNTSGMPVQRAQAFYKVGRDRTIVVHDDLDLPVAALRLKRGGGSGGHNGLKDIVARAGGPGFYRVRIGIGRPPGRQDPADYVLKRPGSAERTQLDVTVEEAADAVLALIEHGLEAAQNRFHAAERRA